MYIDVNNVKLYYNVIGKGKPIILLNGNGTATGYMRRIGDKLAEDYKVYLVDRRCSGKSTRDCNLTYEDSAEDIYQFITKLKIDKPVVLGHSGGGTVVIHLAHKYKKHISKIVLCSGVARYDKKIPKTLTAKILEKLPLVPGKKSMEKFEKLIEEAKTFSKEELSNIDIPALIVNGSKDIVPVEEAEYISNSMPNAKLLVLENATHQSYMMKIYWYDKLKSFVEY